jgi:hypothetical protein
MYNYGHLQVIFADGSVGWYEAGWGPMMSETAFFVKDVITPHGCVSIVMDEGARRSTDTTRPQGSHSHGRGGDPCPSPRQRPPHR